MKTVIQILARTLLGGAFLFSAYAKLYPIEPFELLLLQQGIASWEVAPIFSRLLIASEAILGILIILGVYQKLVLRITTALLVVFTLYILFILLKFGEDADCGCMGDMIKMNPYESILKNVVMLGLTLYLLKFQSYTFKFYPAVIVAVVALVVYPLPFILNPPDSYFASKDPDNSVFPIDMAQLDEVMIDGKKPDLRNGNYILAFFSINCPHCKLAASKLELIKKEVKDLPPVYVIFAGPQEDIPKFLKESKSTLPYHYMDDDKKFIKITHGTFPTLVYIKDGKVIKKFSSFEIDPATFEKATTAP